MTKCSGEREGKICPLRSKCKRYLSEGKTYLAFAPFRGDKCQFLIDKRRDNLEKRPGHIRFDNNYEYVYYNKKFRRYRINWEQNKAINEAPIEG